MYSIGGFTVAGTMLEAATNKSFEQLMTEVMREVEECIGLGEQSFNDLDAQK